MAERYVVRIGTGFIQTKRPVSAVKEALWALRRGVSRPGRAHLEALLAAHDGSEGAEEELRAATREYVADAWEGDPGEAWWEEEQEREAEYEREREREAVLSTLHPDEVEAYLAGEAAAAGREAAAARKARGADGMSERSRREMYRHVLSLPYEMLGERPLFVTLTYPKWFRRWVADGRELEAHRKRFERRWVRGFSEPLVGFWSKEFQLEVGRPHLHMLVRGPACMSEEDYKGFQALTLLSKMNERRYGKREGRAKTPPIGMQYGGQTAMRLRTAWAEIVTGNTVAAHHVYGVNVRTVFYGDGQGSVRAAALARYMAGETAKAGQKVVPDGWQMVGRYFGEFGRELGFRPVVREVELPEDVGRALTELLAEHVEAQWQRRGRDVSDGWRRRLAWQGVTAAGVGAEDADALIAAAWEEARGARAHVTKERAPGARPGGVEAPGMGESA
ncbi:MAG TPA: hypothetical protein VFH56_14810 [Acidimicrobiales bacterium]|nr:hypothetical protein [Acidimicrobiales bacterium]